MRQVLYVEHYIDFVNRDTVGIVGRKPIEGLIEPAGAVRYRAGVCEADCPQSEIMLVEEDVGDRHSV